MKPAVLLKLIFGFVALGLAAVGLFLPLCPTTPFVLLAISCFSATPRLREKLLRISWFREYHESYTAAAGLRRKTVIVSLGTLWATLILSIVLLGKFWITLLLLLIGSTVTAHILWISKSRAGKRRI